MAAEEPGTLTADEALATIARTAAFEEPLRRRVEGVTWMVWGFVTAGVTLSTSAIELGFGYPWPAWVDVVFPWVWLLAGLAGTTAVWRIAALARPEAHPGRRPALVAMVVVVGLIIAIWAVVGVIVPMEQQSPFVLVTLAVPWLALAALNPHRATAIGRKVMGAIGGLLVLGALAWLPATSGLGHGAFPQTMLASALLGGGIPLALGFWQAVRG